MAPSKDQGLSGANNDIKPKTEQDQGKDFFTLSAGESLENAHDSNYLYYKEFCKLYFANIILTGRVSVNGLRTQTVVEHFE